METLDKTDSTFLSIDINRLDREWLGQPELVYVYSIKLADARRESDSLKSKLELVESSFDGKIRKNPKKYGIESKTITESAIRACLSSIDEVIFVKRQLINKKHTIDILTAAVNALEHRKRALEKLVDLWQASYFASPMAGRSNTSREFRELAKREDTKKVRTVGMKRYED